MRKIISFMHVSLDGFVSGPNGEMDWITVNEEIFDHVAKRIEKSDTAMYGRLTYQMMENYWPTAADKPDASKHDKEHSVWYKQVHKIVLSKSLSNQDLQNTTVIEDKLTERIHEIKKHPGSEILLFGSPTATHTLMQLDLIDGYWLFVNPILLGRGIALFKAISDKTNLKLESAKTFSSGIIVLNYTVKRS